MDNKRNNNKITGRHRESVRYKPYEHYLQTIPSTSAPGTATATATTATLTTTRKTTRTDDGTLFEMIQVTKTASRCINNDELDSNYHGDGKKTITHNLPVTRHSKFQKDIPMLKFDHDHENDHDSDNQLPSPSSLNFLRPPITPISPTQYPWNSTQHPMSKNIMTFDQERNDV